jgi:lycopene beta-cyclase
MNTVDADIIVIGGGCAGLSLATRLADMGGGAPRTLILEPRTAYSNDRTWSGWRTAPHRFSACVQASWSRWAVATQGHGVVRGQAAMPYETIPADRFYDAALTAIDGNSALSLHTGTSVMQWGQAGGRAFVTTAQGTLYARLVVDTRPPTAHAGAGLLQSFTGLEIETAQPVFDPETVGLMEFEPASPDAITFLYTLPFSSTRALVELTHMSPQDRAAPAPADVHAMLRGRLRCDFTVLRTETGCLPMRPLGRPATLPPRLLQLGTPAGALRASTGYGFATIQAQAEDLANRLHRGTAAAVGWQARRPPSWMRFMDRLFLRVLHANPAGGPDMFTALFRHCDAAPLIRFLSGTGGLADAGRVALAMPMRPFLREMLPRAPENARRLAAIAAAPSSRRPVRVDHAAERVA